MENYLKESYDILNVGLLKEGKPIWVNKFWKLQRIARYITFWKFEVCSQTSRRSLLPRSKWKTVLQKKNGLYIEKIERLLVLRRL